MILLQLARGAAGIGDQPGQCLTPALKGPGQRDDVGQSLRWTVVCLENPDHALAIRREFGNWREAIDAAGLRGQVGRYRLAAREIWYAAWRCDTMPSLPTWSYAAVRSNSARSLALAFIHDLYEPVCKSISATTHSRIKNETQIRRSFHAQ